MKIVIDMNLGPDWVDCLTAAGHDVVHWSSVGRPDDDDADIMSWAVDNSRVVLTADLDFGTLLAASKAPLPSVVQLRAPNTPAAASGPKVIEALRQSAIDLDNGALVTIHADRFRIRPLPI